jgi:excisionase family DNA binding protein
MPEPTASQDAASCRTESDLMATALLSVNEVCAYLGVSRDTVYRLINAGLLRSLKVQGARRIRRDVLEEYVRGLESEAR